MESAGHSRIPDPELAAEPAPDGLWGRLAARRVDLVEEGASLWDRLDQRLHMAKARPRFRTDLIISQQLEGDTVFYVVKDPVALTYYRFKENEYYVLGLLDGDHEVRDIVQAYSQKYRPIRPQTVQGFLDRIESFGLLVHGQRSFFDLVGARLASRLTSQLGASLRGFLRRALRFSYTVPDTDCVTQRIYRWVRFLFSTPLVVVGALLAASGLLLIVLAWARFRTDMRAILGSGPRLAGYAVALYAGLAVVILVHELAHALTCVHYGGHVHKMGVMFYYISLAAFADTSDAWLFPSRWRRAAVSLAGPLSTLVFSGLGAWTWWVAPAGSVPAHLAVMLVLATVPLTFANLNPFLEYDGYYVLSDLTGIPNLRRRSFDYCWRQVRRAISLLLKRPSAPSASAPTPPTDARQRRIFAAYGTLSSLYLVFLVAVPLARQLSYLVRRFGLLLGGVLVLALVLLFSQRYIRTLIEHWRTRKQAH